jgi:hypothetical protein
MRTNWWTAAELQGANTGFIFSRIAGGARTNAGLSALHGGLAIPGSNIVHSGGLQWPNIELRNPSDQWTVVEGDTIPIMFSYQDFDSSATITFATDGDQNPYNNSPIQDAALPISVSSSSSPSGEIPFFWTPTAADDGRYFFAKITDGVFTRYFYLPTPFHVIPIADFRITAIAQESNNIRVSWTGFSGKTNVLQASPVPGTNYTAISPNIVIIGGGESSTNYLDVGGATNTPSRFYRVRMVQ